MAQKTGLARGAALRSMGAAHRAARSTPSLQRWRHNRFGARTFITSAEAEACSRRTDGVIDRSPGARHSAGPNGAIASPTCLELASRTPSWPRSWATASTGRTYDRNRFDPTLLFPCRPGAVHIWVPALALRAGMVAQKASDINAQRLACRIA